MHFSFNTLLVASTMAIGLSNAAPLCSNSVWSNDGGYNVISNSKSSLLDASGIKVGLDVLKRQPALCVQQWQYNGGGNVVKTKSSKLFDLSGLGIGLNVLKRKSESERENESA